jgi:hypothetical protein
MLCCSLRHGLECANSEVASPGDGSHGWPSGEHYGDGGGCILWLCRRQWMSCLEFADARAASPTGGSHGWLSGEHHGDGGGCVPLAELLGGKTGPRPAQPRKRKIVKPICPVLTRSVHLFLFLSLTRRFLLSAREEHIRSTTLGRADQ